jgi:hypothetical protein
MAAWRSGQRYSRGVSDLKRTIRWITRIERPPGDWGSYLRLPVQIFLVIWILFAAGVVTAWVMTGVDWALTVSVAQVAASFSLIGGGIVAIASAAHELRPPTIDLELRVTFIGRVTTESAGGTEFKGLVLLFEVANFGDEPAYDVALYVSFPGTFEESRAFDFEGQPGRWEARLEGGYGDFPASVHLGNQERFTVPRHTHTLLLGAFAPFPTDRRLRLILLSANGPRIEGEFESDPDLLERPVHFTAATQH